MIFDYLVVWSYEFTVHGKFSISFTNHFYTGFKFCSDNLTLLLLNTTCPVLENSVGPDQLASEGWHLNNTLEPLYKMVFDKRGLKVDPKGMDS